MKKMRLEAEEKSIKMRIKRIKNCDWFLPLLDRAQQFNEITPPVKRFLVAIQQIIEDGKELTEELFYDIHLFILDDNDHKSKELEEIMEYVRKEVLNLNIIDYYNFLHTNKYNIPITLQNDIQEWNYFEKSRTHRLNKE